VALSRDQRWTAIAQRPRACGPTSRPGIAAFWAWEISRERPGVYRLARYDGNGKTSLIQPAGRRFKRRVAVLCNASNSSATFGFDQTCKDNGLATLVGRTSGGNRRGINAGAFFFLQLPASRLEVDLPLIASFPATSQPDAAIEPDIAVAMTVRDTATGRDPQMRAATRRIFGS
jgi:C-terminal processing protease CtpA/Prc